MPKYKIKERREKLGLSQKELIDKSGVSKATISLLENDGEVNVKISTLISIANVLKCSPASLFE